MHKFSRDGLDSLIAGIATLALTGCITINIPIPHAGPLEEVQISGTGDNKVLLIDLSGVISSQDKDGFISQPNMIATLKEELTKAAKDERIKALVVRINSPGGTVTASDILYHELLNYKQKRKVPVVASIMDVGASGGYYIASAADAVLAHPSSVTGSVGVIMLTVNARGLLEKVGVEANAVTSGPRKDMGSPFRAMTPEERAIFQSVIDSFYEQFLRVVQAGRPNLNMEQIRKLADGRIYSGEQAKVAGLVDEIGYLDDAIEAAKKRAGLGETRVVTYRRPGEYQNNIYSRVFNPEMNWGSLANFDLMGLVRGGTPQFMYLWMP
jgi:protease-4